MSRPRPRPRRPNDTLSPSLRAILSSSTSSFSSDIFTASSTGHQVADGASSAGRGTWNVLRGRAVGGQIGEREGRKIEGVKRRRVGDGDGDIRGWFGVGKRRKKEEEVDGKGVRDDGGALWVGRREEEKEWLEREREGGAVITTTTATIPDDQPSTTRDEFDDGISDSDLLLLLDSNIDTSTNTPNPAPTIPPPTTSIQNSNPKPLFATLTIYISGPTTPLITDHRLKHLLIRHGAEIAFSLARRRVTHVVVGRLNGALAREADRGIVGKGSGGGLAAGKLQREISRVAGEGVRFVGVEWVLESIKAGKRLPEARFAPEGLRLGGAGQRSVLECFS